MEEGGPQKSRLLATLSPFVEKCLEEDGWSANGRRTFTRDEFRDQLLHTATDTAAAVMEQTSAKHRRDFAELIEAHERRSLEVLGASTDKRGIPSRSIIPSPWLPLACLILGFALGLWVRM